MLEKKKTQTKTLQGNRVISLENQEDTDNGDDKHQKFINYNEEYDSQKDFSDGKYVAMLEQNNSNEMALQNMIIKTDNTDCNLFINSGCGYTIKNLSIAKHFKYNCVQAK